LGVMIATHKSPCDNQKIAGEKLAE
jgi:hypothetical protein